MTQALDSSSASRLARPRSVVTLRLPQELADRVKQRAKEKGLTVNQLLTQAAEGLIFGGSKLQFEADFDEYENGGIDKSLSRDERNRIADWISLTNPILGRFRLRLLGVEDPGPDHGSSFTGPLMEKRLILSVAVTALGTWLYGGRGAAGEKDQTGPSVNEIKKKADAIAAWILQQSLYVSAAGLPENHGMMVSLGEGAMPKVGETPEQGANPQIAFGRVFARPDVSRAIGRNLRLMSNTDRAGSGWEAFADAIRKERLTVWGAVIDCLEGTSRFSRGEPSGPMVVLHLFNQPLTLTSSYECYMATLTVPRKVVDVAETNSVAIHFFTPRRELLRMIRKTYTDIPARNVHVWTLRGKSRKDRLGPLWMEWQELGVHLVEDDWRLPKTGKRVFTDSGTYAPVYQVREFEDGGEKHLFLVDGYASSAEAIQSASLDRALEHRTFMCALTPKFDESFQLEHEIMSLNPHDGLTALRQFLSGILRKPIAEAEVELYRAMLLDADRASMPRDRHTLGIDDFLPDKDWDCLAVSAAILDDPYSDMAGVNPQHDSTGPTVEARKYKVCVRVVDRHGVERKITLTLGLGLPEDESRRAFSPLLDRLYDGERGEFGGERYETRAVKSSDVELILNELRTWDCNSVIDKENGEVEVNLDNVDDVVISSEKRKFILRILRRYQGDYPALAGHLRLKGQLAFGA